MKMYFAVGTAYKLDAPILQEASVKRVLYSYAVINSKGGGREDFPFVFPEIMLDSGAFSVATDVEQVTLGSYILWLQIYLDKYPQIVTYVNFDNLYNPKETLLNQQAMEAESLKPLPVYHYGEPEDVLDYYCSKYEYVGLGGMAVGTMSVSKLKIFWESVYERYKDNKFHLFGVGTLKPFFKYQPYSIDSLSWIWGRITPSLAGYKNGLPDVLKIDENSTGWRFLTHWRELSAMNARAMLDWEKLEWLKNVGKKHSEESDQKRLF